MLNPAIGKLIEAKDNRYRLVLEVAKEAREISEEAQKNEEIIVEKNIGKLFTHEPMFDIIVLLL